MSVVFSDNFNGGTFSASWDSATGTINATAALEGANGWEAFFGDFDEASVTFAAGTVNAIMRFGFRLDMNDWTDGGGTANPTDFIIIQNNPTGDMLDIDFIGQGGGTIDLRFMTEDDAAADHTVTYSNLTSSSDTWEVRIAQAANASSSDGTMEVFRNGASVGSATGIDNFNIYPGLQSAALTVFAIGGEGDSGSFYIDDITLRDDDTAIFTATNTFRFVGMGRDTGNIYLTGTKDGSLTLYTYTLDGNFTESGTIDFGAATDTELDNRTRDLKPYVVAENTLYLYGRDGNNLQLQHTTGGTGAWTDVGAGTATWATDKVAVGMGANLFNPADVIVGFRDDDIYRTIEGTTNWSKQGDMSDSLNYIARHPIYETVLLAGGTASGTLLFSPNRGKSDSDVSATGGTVNLSDNIAVAESADDGSRTASGWSSSSSTLRMGESFGYNDGYFRFQAFTPEQAGNITNAYLTIPANNGSSGTANLVIYAEDVDNAAQIASAADYDGRTRTGGSVTWDVSGVALGGTATTPDISSLLQTVIDRAGYLPGNAIQIFIEDNGSASNNYLDIKTFDASPSAPSTLTVEYTHTFAVIEAVAFSL